MKTAKIKLTDNDLKFFNFLFKYKVGISEQIHTYCYPTYKIKGVRKRLAKMVSAGFIRFGSTYINNKFYKVFSLTEKGFKILNALKEFNIKRLQLKSNSIVHDLHLVNIFESLKQSRKVDYFLAENELQCLEDYHESDFIKDFVEINSDGYLLLKIDGVGYHVSVEYEHSEKSKKKYEELVIDYYISSSVDVVLFFTKKDWIKRLIVKTELEQYQNQEPKFYFLKMDNELKTLKNFTFINRKGQTLRL